MDGQAAASHPAPVVVVGAVFVDLKCFPRQELNFKGRNAGTARFFHGGVGRNVSETMALLGSKVRFSSSVQQGGVGQEILSRLTEAGVDVSGVNAVAAPDGHGMWVAILHRDGDLACSISQAPDFAHMESAWERDGRRLLDGAGLTVLELDKSDKLAESVLRDAEIAGVPVVGLLGNFDSVRRRPDLISRLHTFVCNQYEAEELNGEPVASIPAAKQATLQLLERGMQQVVVTVGALGSVAAGRKLEPTHIPAMQVEVVDTTGAGDAFVAGLSHALARGSGLKTAVQAGTRVAAWTVSAPESVCRNLRDRMQRDPWEGWAGL